MVEKVVKTDKEWRNLLTPEQFNVTRRKGTEHPFTGRFYSCTDEGMYKCVCCGNELFSSHMKFNSGTGWPSFTATVNDKNVTESQDTSHGMNRTEVRCSRCDAHLGHLFVDGPPPSGLRYCINSAALKFEKSGKDAVLKE